MTVFARLTRPHQWTAGLGWALWTLAMAGLPLIAWLDHLSRQAGRHDLAQLTLSAFVGPVVAMASASTVGAVLAKPSASPSGRLAATGPGAVPGLGWGGPGVCGVRSPLARPGALPAAYAVARYSTVIVVVAQTAAGFVLLLTPTGSLPSPRWRWWARMTVDDGSGACTDTSAMVPRRTELAHLFHA